MVIRSAGITWANVATWLGLVGAALGFALSLAFYAGQMQTKIDRNHAEAMAKLAKIEASLPVMEKFVGDLDKQIQHVRDICCVAQTVNR